MFKHVFKTLGTIVKVWVPESVLETLVILEADDFFRGLTFSFTLFPGKN